jgi:hypothetical protein
VTLPLLFSELGKTSSEELSDLVSLTNVDLETTINAARHPIKCVRWWQCLLLNVSGCGNIYH